MTRAAACTAVASHELALARVLAEDLERFHPELRLVVLVLDGDPPAGEPFETIVPAALGLYRPGALALLTDGPVALANALRPALMARVAREIDGVAIWIESTVTLFGRLDPLVEAGADGCAVVPLQPPVERPLSSQPPAAGSRGIFESGLVAASESIALSGWATATLNDACRRGAAFDPRDDRQLAMLLSVAARPRIVSVPGLCAGWWSAGAGLEDDRPMVLGWPLSAFNLAGFDPRRPHWLSSEDVSGALPGRSFARPLVARAERLLDAGWRPPTDPWSYAQLPGGLPIDDDVRDLYALACAERVDLPNPFSADGCAALLDWLDGAAPAGAGVTRYLERVHRRRPDLRVAFPDLGGADGARLAVWMEDHGAAEEPLLGALLERRERQAPAQPSAPAPAASPPGPAVRLVGFLRDGIGLGEAARSYAGALAHAGVDVDAVSVPVPLHDRSDGVRPPRRLVVDWEPPARLATGEPAVEIVCVNPPELMRLEAAGPRPARRRRIGVWAWELETLPDGWTDAYGRVDEIWVYSEYVARAFRDAPLPVVVMPIPVDVERFASVRSVAQSGDPFLFVFACDLSSTVERKNPLGLIAAFRAAFEPGEGPRLLIKASNGGNCPEALARIRFAALGRSDIVVSDAFMSARQRDMLLASCGCYVSLHRAEGFGLTLAEAMAAGRPTIATGFSGNLDFMTEENSYLVASRPVRVEAGSEIYPAGAIWHEPDVEDAARALRAVHDDQPAARERGERGREQVRALLAPSVVGARARARLEEFGANSEKPRGPAALRWLGRRARA